MADQQDDELIPEDRVLLRELAIELERRDPVPAIPAYVSPLLAFGRERERQCALFGQQHHPSGTGQPGDIELRSAAQRRCRQAMAAGTLTWRHVLDKEIAGAYAETDPNRLEAELTQAGAVIAAWIEDMHDRKRRRS